MLCNCGSDSSNSADEASAEFENSTSNEKNKDTASPDNSEKTSSSSEKPAVECEDPTDVVCLEDRYSSNDSIAFYYPNRFAGYSNYGTLVDTRDGNTYKTVTIDGLEWMAENLNFYDEKYSDMIIEGKQFNYYNLNDEEYEYQKVNGKKIEFCPNGWRVPYINEVANLYASHSLVDLMSVSGWIGTKGTNKTGFSALPSGYAYRYTAVINGASFSMNGVYSNDNLITASIDGFKGIEVYEALPKYNSYYSLDYIRKILNEGDDPTFEIVDGLGFSDLKKGLAYMYPGSTCEFRWIGKNCHGGAPLSEENQGCGFPKNNKIFYQDLSESAPYSLNDFIEAFVCNDYTGSLDVVNEYRIREEDIGKIPYGKVSSIYNFGKSSDQISGPIRCVRERAKEQESITSSSSVQPPSSSSAESSSSRISSSSESSSSSVQSSSSKESTCPKLTVSQGTLTDYRDYNRVYKTVTIDGTTWMAENLNYETDGSYCYGNIPNGCSNIGRVYTWASAMNLSSSYNYESADSKVKTKHQGVCPSGWHIPSVSEWNSLLEKVKNFSEDIKKRQQGCLALFNQFPPPYLRQSGRFKGFSSQMPSEMARISDFGEDS